MVPPCAVRFSLFDYGVFVSQTPNRQNRASGFRIVAELSFEKEPRPERITAGYSSARSRFPGTVSAPQAREVSPPVWNATGNLPRSQKSTPKPGRWREYTY